MPSDSSLGGLKVRRALLTVSDKTGVVELGRALAAAGAELIATGKTASVLSEAGLSVTPIEKVSGSPEAFQGRMKTISFPVCSGILYRRGDASDEADLKKLSIQPIDCVVVNYYPFEAAAAKEGISRKELIEQVDIGGPTLVRAAAKNAPDVLVLTDPSQYAEVIAELKADGRVKPETAHACASAAWALTHRYDAAIDRELGLNRKIELRYGENPHQKAYAEIDPNGPIAWPTSLSDGLTQNELSYNNILDLTACYGVMSELVALNPGCTAVVIVKHQNPCGVALVPKGAGPKDPKNASAAAVAGLPDSGIGEAQLRALLGAWEGDPVSSFGGVVLFSDPIALETAEWLGEKFVELVAAPGLTHDDAALKNLVAKRKKLKAVAIRRFCEMPAESVTAIPGGKLYQTVDVAGNEPEPLRTVTKKAWPEDRGPLARFGIAVCRALKSNAVALVRALPGVPGGLQLIGAGQGQPNRVDALEKLAIPRAQAVLRATQGRLADCVLVSDAFFPFRDAVDAAHAAGIRSIVQPGGSMRDADVIAACDEHGIAMAFTGIRHFRH